MAWKRAERAGAPRPTNVFWRLFGAIALLAGIPTAASCAPAYGYAPNDGQDDQAGLQAEIDRIAAAGGGTLQLEKGVYDIAAPLYLRSGVHIAGRGTETVISSRRLNNRSRWFGTTIFAGNLTPGNFSDDRNEGYPGRRVRKSGASTLTLRDCAPANRPPVGEIVWLASQEGMRGLGDRLRPAYGEVTVVTAVNDCRIDVADPIQVPDANLLIHWSDRSRFLPGGEEPNAPIRNAGLQDLSVEAGEGTALIASGCYRCDFTDVRLTHTLRLIGSQGQRHTRFKNITGDFRWRGIEVVMFARDVLIEDVDAELRDPIPPGNDPIRDGIRPAIRFGEYARNNIVRNVRFRLGEAYVGRDKLRFDESGGNRLENVELIVPRRDHRPLYLYRPPGARRDIPHQLPEGTTLDNVRLCVQGSPEQCETIR